MIFRNKHKERLEIVPVGWDPIGHWVVVEVKGREARGGWKSSDQSLRLKEALELTEWLVSIESDDNTFIEFVEPELAFRHLGGVLSISLEYKYRPPWNPTDPDSEKPYALDFEVTIEELNRQAENWRSDIDKVCKKK